jgi:hypothetical protein
MERREVSFADVIEQLHRQTDFRGCGGMGVLLTSVGNEGPPNAMTIGWGLYGCFYHDHAVAVVAVRPACHTFKLLDEVGEFALCVPTPALAEAVAFCGRESGRDHDKFAECGLTPVPPARHRRVPHPRRMPHLPQTAPAAHGPHARASPPAARSPAHHLLRRGARLVPARLRVVARTAGRQ